MQVNTSTLFPFIADVLSFTFFWQNEENEKKENGGAPPCCY